LGHNPKKPDALSAGSKSHENSEEKKTHRHRHERFVHGHRQFWSEEGYWVDGTTGLPIPAGPGAADFAAEPSAPNMVPAAVSGRPQIHFSVDSSERDTYDTAAQAAGVSRVEWIRSRLNAAAGRELK
jgi:hypothetical protein